MAIFKQHVPRFISGISPEESHYESTQDLLNIPCIKRVMNIDNFCYFAINDNYLMAISEEGFRWNVVGTISDSSILDIEKWRGPKYLAEFQDGSRKVLTKEVTHSRGDDLFLEDGTIVKWIRK